MRRDLSGAEPLLPEPLNRWFGKPELNTTGLRWARPANYMQRGMARGGLLYRTEDRLGFEPRHIDAVFGARAVSWDLSSITDIHLKPTLRRLRVTVTTDNRRQRFIVSNALVVFKDLQSWWPRQVG